MKYPLIIHLGKLEYVKMSFLFGGVHKWGYPKFAGWLIKENPNLKWMMTGGTPMTQETSILLSCDSHSAHPPIPPGYAVALS